jgi:hypothetical protein
LLPRLTSEIRPITIRPIAQLHLADRRNTTKITIARIPTLSSPSNLTLIGQSTFTTFNVYHIFRIMAIYPISQSHNVIFRTLAQIPISRSIASSCPFNIAFLSTCACYQYSRNTFSSVSADVQPRLRPGENKLPRPCLKRHSLPPSHFNTPFRRHVRTPVHINSTGKYASSGLLKLWPIQPRMQPHNANFEIRATIPRHLEASYTLPTSPVHVTNTHYASHIHVFSSYHRIRLSFSFPSSLSSFIVRASRLFAYT